MIVDLAQHVSRFVLYKILPPFMLNISPFHLARSFYFQLPFFSLCSVLILQNIVLLHSNIVIICTTILHYSWLQTQQRKKQHSYSSFHEEHLAQSEQQKDQERHRSELNQQMSEEQRVAILKEVTETQAWTALSSLYITFLIIYITQVPLKIGLVELIPTMA